MRLWAVLLAAAAVPIAASAQTPAEQAQLGRIVERGRLIHAIDRAAWVATDAFMAEASDALKRTARGYIVEPASDGSYTVTFYEERRGNPHSALYIARVVGTDVVRTEMLVAGRGTPLSPAQVRLARARRQVAQLGLRPCTGPFNVTAIPPASAAAPLEVYLLSPQVAEGEYPFGGHFLVALSPDGKPLSTRKFTNSCLTMPDAPGPNGEKAAALGITHLLDPIPTEIHVFTALNASKPVFVAAGERVWNVTGDAITLVGNVGASPPVPAQR